MSDGVRSHWGWGWAARFPARAARVALGRQAAELLGFTPGEPRDPVPLEAVELPPARVAPPPALGELCRTTRAERVLHAAGRSYPDLVRGFQGRFPHPPDLVAHPRDEADVARLLEECARADLALIPFGGGTSVVGGVEGDVGDGFRGVVSLDLRGLNRVLEVDPISLAARIQAGALGPELNGQLGVYGLQLRHFPQSYEFSTLGGWLATRAGGHYATVYTHIDDLVESIRMLTPAGPWESRRLPASGAGPSPDRLVLGSEGTLGVITEAWMRVVPRPDRRARAAVRFSSFARGVAAARAVAQSGLHPTNCRLLDPSEARLNHVCQDGSSVLLLGFEACERDLAPLIAQALALAEAEGGRCPEGPRLQASSRDAGDVASWRSAFLDGPYLRDVLVSLGVVCDTFETACTWERFPELDRAVRAAVEGALRRVCGAGRVSCRFTHVYPDGPAPYYTFLGPGRPGGELEQWAEVKAAANAAILAQGGTITHHHAVGRMHRAAYARQRPAPFGEVLRAIKRSLDPAGILNPGVLI